MGHERPIRNSFSGTWKSADGSREGCFGGECDWAEVVVDRPGRRATVSLQGYRRPADGHAPILESEVLVRIRDRDLGRDIEVDGILVGDRYAEAVMELRVLRIPGRTLCSIRDNFEEIPPLS